MENNWWDEVFTAANPAATQLPLDLIHQMVEAGFNKKVTLEKILKKTSPEVLFLKNQYEGLGGITFLVITNFNAVLFFEQVMSNKALAAKHPRHSTLISGGALTFEDASTYLQSLLNSAYITLEENNVPKGRAYEYLALTKGFLHRNSILFSDEYSTYAIPNLSSEEAIKWLQTSYDLETIFRALVTNFSIEQAEILDHSPKEWLEAFLPAETIYSKAIIKTNVEKNVRLAANETRRFLLNNPKLSSYELNEKIRNSKKNIILGKTIIDVNKNSEPLEFSVSAKNNDISKTYQFSYSSSTKKYYEII